jgi:hypothetical protein
MFGSSFTLLSSTNLNRYLSLPLTSVNSVLSALKSPCFSATYRSRHSAAHPQSIRAAHRLFAFSISNLQFSTFNSFRLHAPNSFRIRTSEKHARKPFRIRSSKTQHLKSFRMCSYKKRGWGPPSSIAKAYSNLRWQSEPALMKRSLPMAMERDTLRRGSGDR